MQRCDVRLADHMLQKNNNFGDRKIIRKYAQNPLAVFKHRKNIWTTSKQCKWFYKRNLLYQLHLQMLIVMSFSDINKIVEVCHLRIYTLMYRSSFQKNLYMNRLKSHLQIQFIFSGIYMHTGYLYLIVFQAPKKWTQLDQIDPFSRYDWTVQKRY